MSCGLRNINDTNFEKSFWKVESYRVPRKKENAEISFVFETNDATINCWPILAQVTEPELANNWQSLS